jgi:hypothetical protein
MYKVRLFFQMLGKEFLKFGIFHPELSLDEMMVRYYGKHSGKMLCGRSQSSSITRYGVFVVLMGTCTIFLLTVVKLITKKDCLAQD